MFEGMTVEDSECAGVKGTSTIPHRLRRSLNLTIEEYAVMVYLDECRSSPTSAIAKIDEADLWKQLGYRMREFWLVVFALEKKDYAARIIARDEVIIEQKWLKHFDLDKQFEELYVLFDRKTSSKKIARDRFAKVIKMIDFPTLYQRGVNYQRTVQHRERDHKKGLDSWLEPSKKLWDDAESNPVVTKNVTLSPIVGKRK